jgi:hypothetical protein
MSDAPARSLCGFWDSISRMVTQHRWGLLSRGLYVNTYRCMGCGAIGDNRDPNRQPPDRQETP